MTSQASYFVGGDRYPGAMSAPRVNLGKLHPDNCEALLALSSSAEVSAVAAALSPLTIELVKIRTWQINGCAFCLRMHASDAITEGETADRLAVLSAWRETGYFSRDETAALALAESVTTVAEAHVEGEGYDAAVLGVSGEQISAVAWLTIVMNTFNRVAITSGYSVRP